ncbi:hypothetical protein F511_16968 [Dorcoceras hygrometricum]|uniref:Uncharacterized protein n=1 Tax=Dorcoceras hygrometricum TaxID=472368 RepID=A0A2Z7AIM0_9LAMI|nr:hypothetical protein F511_16968 [Dorcoceras hygrometricum]
MLEYSHAYVQSSIRSSTQLLPQSDLTRARHQHPVQICFLTGSRKSSTKAVWKLKSVKTSNKSTLTAYGQELRPATTTLLKTNQLKSERKELKKAFPEAQTDLENYRPEIREDVRTCNNFALPQQADPKLQTGTDLDTQILLKSDPFYTKPENPKITNRKPNPSNLKSRWCFLGCYLAGDLRLAPTRITGRLALHGRKRAVGKAVWKLKSVKTSNKSTLTAYGQELRPATTTLLKTNQLKSERKELKKAFPEAQTDLENYRPEIREDVRTCNNFALPQQADPKLQTGTNQNL